MMQIIYDQTNGFFPVYWCLRIIPGLTEILIYFYLSVADTGQDPMLLSTHPSPCFLNKFLNLFVFPGDVVNSVSRIQVLFLTVLDLRCWAQAFSSCSERGLFFLAVRRLLWLRSVSSVGVGFGSCSIQAQQLWCMGSVAQQHGESSQTRGRTRVPSIGRGTLNHWTTEGVPVSAVLLSHCVVLVAQSCPTLYDPRDCSPPDSSVHGILQARILEWVAISFGEIFLYSNR